MTIMAKGADAGLMALFHDARRCGAVIQTDAYGNDIVDPTKTSFTDMIVDNTSLVANAKDDTSHAHYTALCNIAVSSGIHARSGSVLASQQVYREASHKGFCSISPQDAIDIFVAKLQKRGARDPLALRLAETHGITSKAVRDIWNLRTWYRTTKPYWSETDTAHFTKSRLNKTTMASTAIPAPAIPAPVTTVEVAVEPSLSKHVASSSDVADGDDVMQEASMLQEPSTRDNKSQTSWRDCVCDKAHGQIISYVPTFACYERAPGVICLGDDTVDVVELKSGEASGVVDHPSRSQDSAEQTRAQEKTADDLPVLASRVTPKQAGATSQPLACEWLIEPAIVAQEFEEIFLAWQCSSTRRECFGA